MNLKDFYFPTIQLPTVKEINSMSIYISPNSIDNSKYEDAQKLVRQRKLVQLNCFGLYLQDTAGRYIPEEDFLRNEEVQQKIATKTKMCFVIKYVDRPPNESSDAVPENDDYTNVGKNLDIIKDMDPDLYGAISRMIANDNPGIHATEINSRIEAMPGVLYAKNDAVETAWTEA